MEEYLNKLLYNNLYSPDKNSDVDPHWSYADPDPKSLMNAYADPDAGQKNSTKLISNHLWRVKKKNIFKSAPKP